MKNTNWPIHPKWLSLVKGKTENQAAINNDGIFLPDTLRGFIADASSYKYICNPLALFQVVDNSLIFEGEEEDIVRENEVFDPYIQKNILKGRRIIRIDAGVLFPDLSCCDTFRQCYSNGPEECYNIDGRIALLFHPQLPDLEDPDYESCLYHVLNEYNQSIKKDESYHIFTKPYIDKNGIKRFYLYYNCPFSNLKEYFFPVIHRNKIIAVIMQGQRPQDNHGKEYLFQAYKGEFEKLRQSIDNINPTFYLEESCSQNRLDTIFNRIYRLEELISNAVLSKAREYVSQNISEIEKQYKKDLQEVDINNIESTLYKVKESIGKALNHIITDFGNYEFIRIYSEKKETSLIYPNSVEFELIGSSDKDCKTRILHFKDDSPHESIKGDELKQLIREYIHENDEVRMVAELGNGFRYIIWKRYKNSNIQYQEQCNIFKNRLLSMYSDLLEPFYIYRSLFLEKRLEHSMRFTSHESAQIIPLVIHSLEDENTRDFVEGKFEGKPQYLMKFEAHLIIDCISRLMLLSKLLKTPSLLFKNNQDIQVEFSWIDLHRLIYSTKSLFEKKAKLDKYQNIQIHMDKQLSSSSLYTAYDLMSHILFNLVDNSIKYGIRGSNIHITPQQKTIDFRKYIEISIINYGRNPIENKEQIFDLSYRGGYAQSVEGNGIGLHVVKKLSSLLNIQVICKESEQSIEGVNLPYFYYYNKRKIKHEFSQSILDKLNRKIDDCLIDEIVNKSIKEWDIGPNELKNNIGQNIYKTEFIIRIPIDSNNFKRELK